LDAESIDAIITQRAHGCDIPAAGYRGSGPATGPHPASEDPRVSLRSLHIPRPPSLPTYVVGVLLVAAYCGASFGFHQTRVSELLRDSPLVYFVGLHLTFAITPAAGVLGHLASGRPAALGWLGLALGPRELSASLAAFTLGCVVANFSIDPRAGGWRGFEHAAALFANLLVPSAAQAVVFLGVAANLVVLALRQSWRGAPTRGPEAVAALVASALFGLFHLSQSAPPDELANLPLRVFGWLAASTIFVMTRSLLAAILLIDVVSLSCAIRSGAPFAGSATRGLSEAAVALALFFAALWLSQQGTRSPGRGSRR
jgi:hypothetical protein